MPYPGVPDSQTEKMERCVASVMKSGKDEDSAIAVCKSAIVGKSDEAIKAVTETGFVLDDEKEEKTNTLTAVKVAGEWVLDILAIPFGTDDEEQDFDSETDIMEKQFNAPAIMYQHSLKSGALELLKKGMNPFEDKPIPIGEPIPGTLIKKSDGWHIKVILDKTKSLAKKVMDAAKKGVLAVSSGTVEHLARLNVNGQVVPYTKKMKGRIAVWPFAELSLWDTSEGNFRPASRIAYAVPAMKAIYRDAGIEFPLLDSAKAESSLSEEQKAELKKLHNFTDEIEKFINSF